MAEIALRYDLELDPDTDFTEFLPAFKRVFNNSVNASTRRFPNQIIYGFNLANSPVPHTSHPPINSSNVPPPRMCN